MAEHKVIKIVDVDGTPKSGTSAKGNAYQVFKFRAMMDDKQVEISTLVPEFFPLLKADAVLDCEIETKITESGENKYINRTLIQVYIDGKPMLGKKVWGGRGDGDSPEKRASIEAQSAVQAVVSLAVAGKLPDEWQYLLSSALHWCDRRLNPATEKAPDKSTKPVTATPQPLKKETGSPAPQTVKEPVPDEVIPQNLGELYTAVRKHFPEEQRKALNAKDYIASFKPEIDLKDIPKAWKEIKIRSNWK